MSRFFNAGYSDSESSSEEEDLISTSEEELVSSSEEQLQESTDSEFASESASESESESETEGARGPSYFLKKSFMKGNDSDESGSESDGEVKVVKSAKHKLIDEMTNVSGSIMSLCNSNDWVSILAEFDKLNKLVQRSLQQNIGIPKIYIQTLSELDEVISEVTEEEKQNKKKLNASLARALNTTRQRVKKQVREYSDKVELYRTDPDALDAVPDQAEVAPQADGGVKSSASLSVDIFNTLRMIIETRGKKSIDRYEQVAALETLVPQSIKPFETISIYMILIPIRFDIFSSASYMATDQWRLAKRDILSLMTVLEENVKEYHILETAAPTDDVDQEPLPNANGIKEILGSVSSLIERLDDELVNSLQVLDPHSPDYIERLKDENEMYSLILRGQLYCEQITPKDKYAEPIGEQLARLVLRRLEHVYYKPIKLIIHSEKIAWNSIKGDSVIYEKLASNDDTEYCNGLLDSICSVLYNLSNSVFRKRAMLCHIYYYAFNDNFYKARDMLLMSHLQSSIHTSDVSLQVLFNRAIVQLGLCAFRSGLIEDAHQLLQEIAGSQRQKELLGQGSQKMMQQQSQQNNQQNPGQSGEKLLPFHMHINLELFECCFLTSSMLLEVPQIAKNEESYKRKYNVNSLKSFRKIYEFHQRSIFKGPPENTRDYILHAADALLSGDFEKAIELINHIKIWNLFNNKSLKSMLSEKLTEQGLKTYIYLVSSYYSKLSLQQLADKFHLSISRVTSILSQLIFTNEIAATLDLDSEVLIFQENVEVSDIQELALQLTEKLNMLYERTEKLANGGYQVAPQQGKKLLNKK